MSARGWADSQGEVSFLLCRSRNRRNIPIRRWSNSIDEQMRMYSSSSEWNPFWRPKLISVPNRFVTRSKFCFVQKEKRECILL